MEVDTGSAAACLTAWTRHLARAIGADLATRAGSPTGATVGAVRLEVNAAVAAIG